MDWTPREHDLQSVWDHLYRLGMVPREGMPREQQEAKAAEVAAAILTQDVKPLYSLTPVELTTVASVLSGWR